MKYALLFLAACGSGGGTSDADDAPDCSTVTGVDTFTVGLDKPGLGSNVDFKLMSISPAPVTRGNNTWVVQLDAMADNSPIAGAALTVTPWMPAHQHTSQIPTAIAPTANAGEYSLTPVNLWMPGVWQVTIAVSSPSTDRAVYSFCVN